MRLLSLGLSLALISTLGASAMADEYKFMCKNMFWVSQLMKVEAKTQDEARFKLKHDRAYKDYSACSYQSVTTDEQRKKAKSQDTWGSRFKTKVKNVLEVPPAPVNQ